MNLLACASFISQAKKEYGLADARKDRYVCEGDLSDSESSRMYIRVRRNMEGLGKEEERATVEGP